MDTKKSLLDIFLKNQIIVNEKDSKLLYQDCKKSYYCSLSAIIVLIIYMMVLMNMMNPKSALRALVIVLSLFVMLVSFLAAIKVKKYIKKWSSFIVILGGAMILQAVTFGVFQVLAHLSNHSGTLKYIITYVVMILFPIIAGVAFIISGITSYKDSIKIDMLNKQKN